MKKETSEILANDCDQVKIIIEYLKESELYDKI